MITRGTRAPGIGTGLRVGPGPGDTVLLKSKHRIILSVCNVFFEANRPVLQTPLTTERQH